MQTAAASVLFTTISAAAVGDMLAGLLPVHAFLHAVSLAFLLAVTRAAKTAPAA